MGIWNAALNSNDTFNDIYHSFFGMYNQGHPPAFVSKEIINEFGPIFNDHEDGNNALFALAFAQWETKALDSKILERVKEIIDTEKDIELWKALEADDNTIKERKIVLADFLSQISTERNKPKRRVKEKFEITSIELINLTAPDGKKRFTVSEIFTNGDYDHTSSMLSWDQLGAGSGIFNFTYQGKHLSARWINSATLEITYDKSITINFGHNSSSFNCAGDKGEIVYVAV